MKNNLTISGLIRLTSPLHFAGFEKSKLNDEGRPGTDGKPLTRTQVMNVIGVDGTLVRDIPYVSGNSFRGALRREATAIILARLADNNEKVTIDTFHGMACGAVVGVPDTSMTTIGGLNKAKNNLFMGVFGGGPNICRSGYSVSDLLPIVSVLIDIGMVPDGIAEAPHRLSFGENGVERGRSINNAFDGLTHYYHVMRIDDIERYVDVETMQAILNFDTEATQWLLDIFIESAEKKQATTLAKKLKEEGFTSQAEAGKPRLKVGNMVAFEAITAGTPMYFDLNLSGSLSDAQIGLMLKSLESFVHKNKMGGINRSGLGHFDASALKITDGEQEHQLFIRRGHKLILDETNEFIAQKMEAFISELDRLTAEEMNSFYYRSAPPKKDTKNKASEVADEAA